MISAITRKVSITSRVLGAERFRRRSVLRAPGRRFLERFAMNARMLANVERVQVQPEGANHEQQRIDERLRQANAPIGGEAAADHG